MLLFAPVSICIDLHAKQVRQGAQKIGGHRAGEGDDAGQYHMDKPAAAQTAQSGGGKLLLKR